MYKLIQLVILLFLLSSSWATAQQVIHIENRRMADPRQGFSGDISLEANLTQNFNNSFETKNLVQLHYVKKRHRVLSISGLRLTLFNKTRTRNDGYQHLRYNFMLTEKWSPEAFVQYQYDQWLKIDFRALHGAGMRYALLHNDSTKTKMFMGLSYMYEYEEEATDRIERNHRGNVYLSVGVPLGKIVHFDAIGYFQPNLKRIADFRTSVETTVDVRITKSLSLLLSYSLVYDGSPPEGMRNTFYDLENGLRYRF